MRRISASWGLLPIVVATVLTVTGLTATGCLPGPSRPLPEPSRPRVLAALGDSITRGFDACRLLADCPQVSWATGTDPAVRSYLVRLSGSNLSGAHMTAYNDALTGASSADLPVQTKQAVRQRADHVTVLIGANDVCTDSERQMTPSAEFGSRLHAALSYLHNALPGVRVFVASIPDVYRLWQVSSVVPQARLVWQVAGVCRSMLANPSSSSRADAARRLRVRQRIVEDNAAMHQACAAVAGCTDDGGAVYRYRFTLADLSGWDFFHPNPNGQRILSDITFRGAFGG
ncbi:MAG: SGNH/GDSL hydrolase family protein [Frankiaceae bacterium]